MKKILQSIAVFLCASLAFAQPQTVTTTANQTITGVKTFSGSNKLCLKDPGDADLACIVSQAISGSVTITLPAATGTLLYSGGPLGTPASGTLSNATGLPISGITGLGTGVGTWLATPSGANLVSALSSGGGSTNFLRADGTFAAPAGSAVSGLTSGRVVISTGTTSIGDDAELTYDSTNNRLMLGGATSTSTLDIYESNTVNAAQIWRNENLSTSTAGMAALSAQNSSGLIELRKYSTGFTASGLIAGALGSVINNTGDMLIASTGSGKSIIFATAGTAASNRAFTIDGLLNVIVGDRGAALATTATDGFFFVPAAGGAHTGVPAAYTGNTAPVVWDGTNKRLQVYGGSWYVMPTLSGNQTFAGTNTFSAAPIVSTLTAARITIAGASKELSDTSSLSWDSSNVGLLIGTATANSGRIINAERSTDGPLQIGVKNTSSGTAAYAATVAVNDGGKQTFTVTRSSGFTTTGLSIANGSEFVGNQRMLFWNISGGDIIFSPAGQSNEAARFLGAAGSGSLAGNLGIGQTNPTALLHIKAGAATAGSAPLKLTSGTNNTTGETGAVEYDGTNLTFVRTGTTRETVLVSAGANVVSPTSPNRTVTINIGGTTYYLAAKTTND